MQIDKARIMPIRMLTNSGTSQPHSCRRRHVRLRLARARPTYEVSCNSAPNLKYELGKTDLVVEFDDEGCQVLRLVAFDVRHTVPVIALGFMAGALIGGRVLF